MAMPPAAIKIAAMDRGRFLFPDLVTPSRSPETSPASTGPEGNRKRYVLEDPSIPLPPESVEEHADLRRNLKPLPQVTCTVRARIPTTAGHVLWLHGYSNSVDNKEHLAFVFGNKIRSKSLDEPRPGETEYDRITRGAYDGRLVPGRTHSRLSESITAEDLENALDETKVDLPSGEIDDRLTGSAGKLIGEVPLVRIHSECYTGETVGSSRCDCGDQLNDAGTEIAKCGSGVIVYLRQEGRGIGLFEKLKAYNLQDLGRDTVEANILLHHPADARDYGLATSILLDLGCSELDLLTNNPLKITAVEGPHREIKVRQRVEMTPRTWQGKEGVHGKEFDAYMDTKITRMGHLLGRTASGI